MTAINAFIRGREVHVLTDAAYLEATGRLVFIGSKIGLLPHVNAVCVTRGEGEIEGAFRAMLGTAFTSFDALTSGFRQAVQKVIDGHDAGRGYAPFEVMAAGISEFSGKPDIRAAFRGDTPEPVQFYSGKLWASPFDGVSAALKAKGIDLQSDAFDPVMNGVELLEAQRARVIQPAGFPPCHIVGGFAQLTTVSAAGITTRVLKRWPDQVGQRIVP